MAAVKELWNRCMVIMEQKLQNPVSMDVWLKQIRPVEITGEKATLSVPSAFYWEIIRAKFYNVIKSSLEEAIGFPIAVEIVVDAERVKEDIPSLRPELSISTLSLNEEYTFETFVVGNSNRFAHAACQAVANNPAKAYNPLFLYGGSGLGKTHLLYAIIRAAREKFPSYNILYVSCEDFTNELIEAIGDATMIDFRNKYRAVDLLLVDDIQFIGGKEQTQEEFFHTFDTLYRAGKQIVLASDRPPKEIQQLTSRLKNRFESGLLADIQVPDYELRMAIINKKAESLGLLLPPEVVEFLANKIKNNVRQIEGALKKVLAFNLINQTTPSIAVAQSAVADILNTNEPVVLVVDRIITEVARYYGISADDIKSKKRTSNITMARQVSMYIIREVCQLSLPLIGEEFDGRDHSTVHHSIRKVEAMMETNSSFRNAVNDIIHTVKEK